MEFENKIKELMELIAQTLERRLSDESLPENTFYLNNGDILCCPRKNGESRYPYVSDGLTLWAYSNGTVQITEGVFNVFRPVHTENESPVNFFAGIKRSDGTFFPISVTGGCRQLFEPFEIKRYVVYSFSAAYYLADTDFATFCVRMDVARDKSVHFSFGCLNKKSEPLYICLISYIEPLLKNGGYDDMWARNYRTGYYYGDGKFIFKRINADYHAMGIVRKISGAHCLEEYHTVSRPEFLVYQERGITNAECLKNGRLEKQSCAIGKMITPAAAELLHLEIGTADFSRVDYRLNFTNRRDLTPNLIKGDIDTVAVDREIEERKTAEKEQYDNLTVCFEDWNGKVNPKLLNRFIRGVQKQVNLCAMGKNYVEHLIGTRDVFQQLEQALIWDPEQAREKIIRSISFIDPSGRAARQFSIPQYGGQLPRMDLQAYIDQGNWIISTLYTYLSYTDDYSILDESCGFYEFVNEKTNSVRACGLRTTLADHLIRITDYLDRNLDREDNTYCLRALHGDWNDAIDGLGASDNPEQPYGNGVSVMATLHFYQNLTEMINILTVQDVLPDKAAYYTRLREKVKNGLLRYAVEHDGKGNTRLIHGWGNHRSYKVGSFKDSDGRSRISFAPNAFWATSGMIENAPELREVILHDLHALDSEYGIITNKPAFTSDMKEVGRICNTLPGTAENCCAYVHASMFSVMALFALGDGGYAWEELEKSMVISHQMTTKSPFVFSNSYCENQDEGISGFSAIDWFTGSGTVFIKNILRAGFGIEPDLLGLNLKTCAVMPCKKAHISLTVKGKRICVEYKNSGVGKRRIQIDGRDVRTSYDSIRRTECAHISTADLHDNMRIQILD